MMQTDRRSPLTSATAAEIIEPLAYKIEAVPSISGLSRTRVFQAIREKKLMAKKAGRQTIIEADELRRFLAELPTIGRQPERGSIAA
jgi:hypothetical protein